MRACASKWLRSAARLEQWGRLAVERHVGMSGAVELRLAARRVDLPVAASTVYALAGPWPLAPDPWLSNRGKLTPSKTSTPT